MTMIVERYKELASMQLAGAGIKKIPPEIAQQAIDEVAYGMIFNSIRIITKTQLAAIIKRNTDHTELIVQQLTKEKELTSDSRDACREGREHGIATGRHESEAKINSLAADNARLRALLAEAEPCVACVLENIEYALFGESLPSALNMQKTEAEALLDKIKAEIGEAE